MGLYLPLCSSLVTWMLLLYLDLGDEGVPSAGPAGGVQVYVENTSWGTRRAESPYPPC